MEKLSFCEYIFTVKVRNQNHKDYNFYKKVEIPNKMSFIVENNVETSTKSTETVEITTTLNEIDNNLDSKTEMIETYETESDRETVNPTTESYSCKFWLNLPI